MERLLGDPVEVAHQIKDRLKNDLGFTVNIGISVNKLLAKMAGELRKPDMVHTLFPEEIPSKMWPLPVEELFMVGSVTAKKLRSRGIQTINALANFDRKSLRLFLKSHGELIWNYANGIDSSPVRPGGSIVAKGMGNSTTLPFDVEDRNTAHLVLLSLVETVGARLRDDGCCAQLVSISIRTNEFFSLSHQKKLTRPTDCTEEIWNEACGLFDELWRGQPMRHMGIRVSELSRNDFSQLALFGEDYSKHRQVDRAVDAIRLRYGKNAIIRSSFLDSGLKALTGGVPEEDYPVMTSLL